MSFLSLGSITLGQALLGSAFISGISSLVGGFVQGAAIKEAAKLNAAATSEGNRLIGQSIEANIQAQLRAEAQAAPFIEAGKQAIGGIQESLENIQSQSATAPEFNLQDIDATDAYKFRQEELERALARGDAARGLVKSGASLEALARGTNALTADEVDRSLARQTQVFQNQLQSFQAGQQNLQSVLASQLEPFRIGANVAVNQGSQAANFSAQRGTLTQSQATGMQRIGDIQAQGRTGSTGAALQGVGQSLDAIGNIIPNLAGAKLISSQLALDQKKFGGDIPDLKLEDLGFK